MASSLVRNIHHVPLRHPRSHGRSFRRTHAVWLISKKAHLVLSTFFLGILIYLFFAHTYIGQSNPMIRRMRTAFHPTEDASFNVRAENKKKLAVYLKTVLLAKVWGWEA